jgi:hypothetical protein
MPEENDDNDCPHSVGFPCYLIRYILNAGAIMICLCTLFIIVQMRLVGGILLSLAYLHI